jgi:hypothetical protein
VCLVGPIALGHLDRVTLKVINELADRDDGGGMDGSFRFAEAGDAHGRWARPVSIRVGGRVRFDIWPPNGHRDRSTVVPSRAALEDSPMRLVATCDREGFASW